MYIWCKNEARSCNHIAVEKQKLLTHSERVFVALGIQHAMRMRHILICGTIFNNKKVTEHEMVFFLYKSTKFFILTKTERDKRKNVYWFSCKDPVILIRF